MLEIKNLSKIYKGKGDSMVKALDDVSIVFPETGMIFLLGKSGSGKSTLLNVTGGLDKPTSGEIIIKGRNSNTFSGADFDSYRNTYIGFVFQEYNILNDFNIEQNISLALQLQGKKNDKAAVEKILDDVDLSGYGKRKPNTLSGGQKQRIAIARALIKNPEIIMADEPTGALDSNTGKQVFDTLKKLSKEKLVIVVSHDREFAEIYGDRIIELADGKIISDTSKEEVEAKNISDNVSIINDNALSIKDGKNISKEEIEKIYDIIKAHDGELIISSGNSVKDIKKSMHINENNKSEVFMDTKEIKTKEYNGKDTKFIRSRLPFARALKMGASSLKSKPIRMIFTIFLTIVSLVMFGVASTLLFYNANYSLSTGLEASDYTFDRVKKYFNGTEIEYTINADGTRNDYTYERNFQGYYSDSEIESLNNNNVSHNYCGLFGNTPLEFIGIENDSYYQLDGPTALAVASEEYMSSNGFTRLAGEYPKNVYEIAITKYFADAIIKSTNSFSYSSYNDLIGQEFSCRFYSIAYGQKFYISGIYDVGIIPNTYDSLKETKDDKLKYQFEQYLKTSYHSLCFVIKDFYYEYDFQNNYGFSISAYYPGKNVNFTSDKNETYYDGYYESILPSEYLYEVKDYAKFYNFKEEEIEYNEISGNECYIPYYTYYSLKNQNQQKLYYLYMNMFDEKEYSDALKTYFSSIDKEEFEERLNRFVYTDELNYPTKALYQEDKAFFDNLYNTYYETYRLHKYNASKITILLNGLDHCNKKDLIEDYDNALYLVNNYTYFYSTEYRNDTVYNQIMEKIGDIKTFEEYIIKEEARWVAEQIVYSIDSSYYYYINEKDCNTYYELANKAINNLMDLTDNEINALRHLVIDNWKPTEISMGTNAFIETYGYKPEELKDPRELVVEYYLLSSKGLIDLDVKGYYLPESNFKDVLISKEFFALYADTSESYLRVEKFETNYKEADDAIYHSVITKTNYTKDQIANLLAKTDTYSQTISNPVYGKLQYLIEVIGLMKNIFLITGLVFAAFASLMLFNFISSSISSKTKEIGILRAVGARGSDLFKIFFSESGIIAIICFTISIILSIVVCYFMNKSMSEGLGFKLLEFTILDGGLIVAGSFIIAILGTFIPVLIASKKAPIESIRTL